MTAVTYNVKYTTVTGSYPNLVFGAYSTAVSGTSLTTATVTGLTNATPYAFEVTAVIGGVESAPSPYTAATPSSEPNELNINDPGGQDTGGVGAGYLFVNWAPVPGAPVGTSYNLYYSTSPVTTSSTKLSSFTGVYATIVSGLTVGATYYFGLSATVGGVESAIYTGGTPPAQIGVTAESTTNTIVQVSDTAGSSTGIIFGPDPSAPTGSDGFGGVIYATAGSTVTLTVNYVGGVPAPLLFLGTQLSGSQQSSVGSTGYETFTLTAPSKGSTNYYNFYDLNETFNFSIENFSIAGQ